jgi:hypothetical protein
MYRQEPTVSRALVTLQRARRSYRCAERRNYDHEGYDEIKPGDYYARTALPPHDDTINNARWLTDRICLACALRFGYDTSCRAATISEERGDITCHREVGHTGLCAGWRTRKQHPTGKPYYWYGTNLPQAVSA